MRLTNFYLNHFSGVCTLLSMCCVCFFSCSSSEVYNGDSIVNYPDMHMLLKQYMEPFQQEPYSFKVTTLEDGNTTSKIQQAKDIDWKLIQTPFLKADIFNPKLDKHYKLEVLSDTLQSTLLLTPINKNESTKTMSIKGAIGGNNVRTIYAETHQASFFSSEDSKILYVVGKTIQIQEHVKKPFSKVKHKITTITFLN